MKKEILKKYFGFGSFRGVQEEAIDKILRHEDVLCVLPTGSGKSLIYQHPTMMMEGVTVVISPLIALMQDQVANLNQNGIHAKMIHSGNTEAENGAVFQGLLDKTFKFLYVAPERFVSEYFLSKLKQVDINFFVIDEAHCVSEWGHEFRDDYRKLRFLRDWFPKTPITAFTATATKSVEADISQTLKIAPANILKTTMKRENLTIWSQKRAGNGLEQIETFIKAHAEACGIIYCFTRKETEQLAQTLQKKGYSALAYHAGLPGNARSEIFRRFKEEEVKVVVATIAFGMGIDKSNIRFVIHTSMPKTLENYTQEIGRAGRDGLRADTLLLYAKSDEIGKRRFIDELPESDYKTNSYKKLEQMYRFCISGECRHRYIARYFDDTIEACGTLCDNCLEGEREMTDITTEAQKLLSAVIRCEERYGQNYIIDVLRGSQAKRVLDSGHDKLSVYGIGAAHPKEYWGAVADRLLDAEAVIMDGEYRTLRLAPLGYAILKGEQQIGIAAASLEFKKSYEVHQKEDVKNEVFEKFRELRAKLAKEESVPAYLIFSDKTLLEIAHKLPATSEAFLAISGVGESKLEKYGEIFTALSKTLLSQGERPGKELSKTYNDTLELIQKGSSVAEICETRGLREATVLGHIGALFENGQLNEETKNRLCTPLIEKFPAAVKAWIEEGVKIADIAELRACLAQYPLLFAENEHKNK